MNNPVATYRIQFHSGFTFADFEKILPYLTKLGIGTLYASPVFEAVPGSMHGYDGVNPNQINPEIGTEKQLRALSKKLRKEGIGWLQDIVPNHMAYHPNNPWLMDVLEKGPLSRFVPFFDTVWTSQLFRGRLAVPFLGAPVGEVIENRELNVAFRDGRFVLTYFDTAYPLRLRSYPAVLQATDRPMPESIQQLLDQIRPIQLIEEPEAYALAINEFRQQLISILKNPPAKAYVKSCLSAINRQPDRIQQLADEQHYKLSYHQETDRRINFRRFFTVTNLIGLNIQNDEVFAVFHQQIKALLDEGVLTGLRIDHIDGLFDPGRYLKQLRALVGDETYLVVEKILGADEPLPDAWPVQGTTGYEFLAQVNNLLTQSASEAVFTRFYQQLVNDRAAVQRQILNKKAFILAQSMQGELDNLYRFFLELNLVDDNELALLPTNMLPTAIGAFLIYCPVYRFYGTGFPLEEQEAQAVRDILQHIRNDKPELTLAIDLLDEIFLQKPQEGDSVYRQQVARFYQRCMQFTGPLMAKGVEDTLMYTYNRFIVHNEVGDSPAAFGWSPDEFHRAMQERRQRWPLALNATATHDTKRGEDVRTRLNVLTDWPEVWIKTVQEWQQMNADLKKEGSPDANDEYFIYQTLLGTYPMPGTDEDDFENRLTDYLEKALREAKRHSNWSSPNTDYEETTKQFVRQLLNKKRPFLQHFKRFHRQVADFGIINSLAQVMLKMTCPGVPDIYQGCEGWDLSLVDPDNRRPVDFAQREMWLEDIIASESGDSNEFLSDLWKNRYDARIKLWLTHTLLKERKQQPDLFAEGRYIPLAIEGTYRNHVLAFARQYRENWLIVAIPLHLAALSEQQKKEIPVLDWKDTRILLPPDAPAEWYHGFLKTRGTSFGAIAVKEIFTSVPMAMLNLKRSVPNRSAGLLLPVTSLPSAFGVGDLGPEATAFADLLARSRQKYWQMLPLNPTDAGAGHSPYSTHSSMAGNTLLVSPELLVQDGLLNPAELAHHALPTTDTVDYTRAGWVRNILFEKAFQTFRAGGFDSLQRQFQQFCRREAYWLDDYALYQVFKQQFKNDAWFQWPTEYRLRDAGALQSFAESHPDALEKVRWLQFIFDRQWQGLKTYCNNRGIQLLGDLPFYVSYDSADVWSHPDIFSLDETGKLVTVAGVPPDYFNANGQLWGMPVFHWNRLKERKYDWWVRRIRKNCALFDQVRIDHFRALSEYWEIPAGAETAIDGEWKPGPGADFFRVLKKELGTLPLVAEDLGDISEDVYRLRDAFKLPGMKVIQFAFHSDPAHSPHIPHNYTTNFIAYTGTHDNNTTRGWYRQSLRPELRKKVAQYVGKPVSDKNVHLVLAQLVYASVAKTVILPVQDVLGLDETARINTPAAVVNNWLWRLKPGQLTPEAEIRLQEWTTLYNRW
ncbi:malto-oligosyltrehalose synthase [Larkinella rosea]|uniref:4-alpha-glucanotransferase n=1 Tax=Larkinella rosea TaxID=2025312 RepID=A0A3P1BVS2_9BACT|nr:malto-oligosyltrehalose synthase [Larkinella rosea]RRB04936.1 malto-oligosyltrehalose synthase [Larkinella rosea]